MIRTIQSGILWITVSLYAVPAWAFSEPIRVSYTGTVTWTSNRPTTTIYSIVIGEAKELETPNATLAPILTLQGEIISLDGKGADAVQ